MTCFARLLVLAAVCTFTGCAAGTVTDQVRNPTYSWGFHNPSEEQLDNVQATYEADGVRDTPGAGWLRQGVAKGHGPGLHPIPDTVTLVWTTDDNQGHQAVMEVASQVPEPRRFSGTIYFVYLGREHGWKVVPLTAQELNDQGNRAARGTLGQRNPLAPTPDKYLPATRPAGDAGE